MTAAATVVVPTHRGADTIGALLGSLDAQSVRSQVIVVDNASSDGTAGILAARGGLEVIRQERNLGFGPAINLAARRAEGDVLVLVNDDCVCDPGFVEAIARPIEPASGVAMAAGVLRDQRDQSLIDTAGIELDSSLLVFDYLNGEPVTVLDGPVADPIGPCGAAAAFDRDAFLEVGGFDENLFAYWEDVDLALRLGRAGARCALAKDARGTHHHSATLGSGSAAKNELVGFGRGYVLRKWGAMSARRAPGVLFRDGVICVGQAVVDRNVAGVRGRLRGWRSAERAGDYPAELLAAHRGPGALRTLRRRWRRRSRLRAR